MLTANNVLKTTLSNGLTVLTERMEHVRSVSVGVWLKTGAEHDAPELNGISHLFEHMVFKGTSSLPAKEISLECDRLGGDLDAATGVDTVAFSATVLDARVGPMIHLLSDLLLNPLFLPEEIERERSVVMEEIKGDLDDPLCVLKDTFLRTMWGAHPIARPICGTPETVGTFSRETLLEYAKNRITGRNMLVVAAGNLQHDDIVAQVDEAFGRAPAGCFMPRGSFPKSFCGQALIERPNGQVQMLVGFPAPADSDPAYFTAHLLAMLLGGGASSRLFQSVREKSGLAYTIFSRYMPFRMTGYLGVWCGTSKANVNHALDLISKELQRLKSERVSSEEFTRLKDIVITSQILSLESSSARAQMLAGQYLALGRPMSLVERQAEIESVTEDQVMSLANTLFNSDRMVISMVGDVQGMQVVPDLLNC